jgi:PAS domain S-box-containing protein
VPNRPELTQALHEAALAVSTAEGEHVFEQLVTALARILGVEFALISVYVEPQRTMLRTLATFCGGRLARNVEYPVAGTPCEYAIGRTFGFFPSGVARRYPHDRLLAEHGVEGYAATTLHDVHGAPIGALTVMSHREITDASLTEAMLKIFAARVSAEIERRRSEASYRAIFDNAEACIFVHDYDTGAIVDVNPKACATYGYGAEEMRRLTVGDLSSGAPPYTGADALRLIERARRGEVVRGEWHRRNRDGSLHWDEITLKKVEIAGRPHILVATREITGRKAAEEALRASEEQYRAVFNATTDALVLRDADFRVVDVNPAYEVMSGRRREDVLGSDRPTMRVLDAGESALTLHRRVLAGKPERSESDAQRGDGSRFRIEVMAVPMQYRGAPHVLYIGRDITARRAAEEALRASEEQYRAIFNASVDGMLLWDAGHRVVDVNEAFVAVHGFRREELIGITEPVFLPPELRGQCATLLPGVLAGRPCYLETRSRRKDGGDFAVEIHGIPMQYRGQPHVLIILRDVTARHEAETRLRASEEQYRAIYNATADALALRDAEFRIVDVNAAYEAMTGRRRADAIGQVGLTITDDDGAVDRRALHSRALAGEPVRIETEGRRPDGTPLVLEVRGVPVTHRGVPHVLYIGRDITARKSAEEALRASEEQYRAIFNATADALVLRDTDFRIVDVNAAYEAMSGKRRDEVLGLEALTVSANDVAKERRALHTLALAGEPVHFETQGRRRDGTLFVLEVRGVPISYGGRPHVLYIGRDITERVTSEQALRASWEQYRSIFNATADSLVLRDADFRIVDVNPAYEAMSGRTRAEALGRTDLTMSSAELTAHVRALHQKALAGEPVTWEAGASRKSGERFFIEVRGVPVLHQGQPHVLYIGRDITGRKRAEAERAELEAQLRQAQKMEAIGQLTGGIAHDFNNILQGILGNLVLAEERQAELGDERIGRYLERARQSSQRARDLVQQMLTFSRGRRGERKPAALAALVREAVKLLRSSLPATLELRTELAEGLPAVAIDAVQIEQVLMNLCINARDAMGGEGAIDVRVRAAEHRDVVCASCRQRVAGSFVELSVRDTGSGIEPRVLDRVFDPFFSTKEVGKGSGMGLAMVHGIVHQHGGHVLVESSPGKGTEFRVLLEWPEGEAKVVPAREPEQRGAPSRPRFSGRVLVADDEPIIREFLRDLLGGWGLDVVACDDGVQARDAFAEDAQGFDLVITDQTMPRLTGLQLAKLVSRMRPGIPVILCTGYGEDLQPGELRAAGVRTLAKKPVEPQQLRELLREALPARNKAPT